jgi:hypothetical protein
VYIACVKSLSAIVAVFLPAVVFAQVTISIPQQQYKPHEQIDVVITNTGRSDVSFCVEYGQWSSLDNGQTEVTPTPVYIQRMTERGWSTLLDGPDIGSIRVKESLNPGESRHYPIRLIEKGKLHFVLDYWIGGSIPACSNPKGSRRAKSREFFIE